MCSRARRRISLMSERNGRSPSVALWFTFMALRLLSGQKDPTVSMRDGKRCAMSWEGPSAREKSRKPGGRGGRSRDPATTSKRLAWCKLYHLLGKSDWAGGAAELLAADHLHVVRRILAGRSIPLLDTGSVQEFPVFEHD